MATEDIDLTWRLLLSGWHTVYEPEATDRDAGADKLAGAMDAAHTLGARAGGGSLHRHLGTMIRWRRRGMWPVALESLASLCWVIAWAFALVVALVDLVLPSWNTIFGIAIAWGVAIAVVCTLQLATALALLARYDARSLKAFLLGPLYPLFF